MSSFAHAQTCRIQRNEPVEMRDGVALATSLYLPGGQGPFPTVLVRTAYNRVGLYDSFFPVHGMALVVQDCRGRYASGGEWDPFVNEAADGADTLEWLHRQPWCDGRVGMFGDSYLAATQFDAAREGGDLLTALNPRFMSGDCWKRAYYCDGAFSLALTWSWLCFESPGRTSEAATLPMFDVENLLRRLPIVSLDAESGAGEARFYRDYVRRNRYDEEWAALNLGGSYDRFTMPVLLTGGWYDNYPAEAFRGFLGLRAQAPTDELRDAHRLLIGPWPHGMSASTTLGELDFGEEALEENDSTHRWLDCILHGGKASDFQEAPIRIFVMGANRWRDEYEWPLARTRYVEHFLRADGRLSAEPPASEAPDAYTYDPTDPTPTHGGNHSVGPYNPGLYELAKPGPYDQRPVEERSDVLVYTSEPLADDTEVTGHVVLKLFASTRPEHDSETTDTDWVARLTDVYPDGRSINITEGVIRARFREGIYGPPKLIEPGRVYEYTVDLQATSNVFMAGHRIRLQVTSSNFPLWDRNLNTGNDPATDTQIVVAEQAVFHDAERPSRLVLPVVG